MSCFNDEKLLKYINGQLDPLEENSIKEHILGCDDCFENYYFLFQLPFREKQMFKQIPQEDIFIETPDFIISLDSSKPLQLADISLLKTDVQVEKLDLMIRAHNQSYPGLKIHKNDYPDMYLFQDEKPNWTLYLEDEVDMLTILADNTIHYKAPYRKLDLLLLPLAKKYTILKEGFSPFSFQLL